MFQELKQRAEFEDQAIVKALLAAVEEFSGCTDRWVRIEKKVGKPRLACRWFIMSNFPVLYERTARERRGWNDPKDIEALLAAVKEHGAQWAVIGKKLNRTGSSCREYIAKKYSDILDQVKRQPYFDDPKNVDALAAAIRKYGNDRKPIMEELGISQATCYRFRKANPEATAQAQSEWEKSNPNG